MNESRFSRRQFLRLSAAASSIAVMAACVPAAPQPATGEVAPAAAPTKLTVICVNDMAPALESIANPQFTEATGIADIEMIPTAWNDIHEKIVTMATGGTTVDVTYVDTIWPGEFAQAGFVLPMDQYITDEIKTQLFESSWQQSIYQGSIYAMPYSNNAKWLFWNTEMMAAAGIEKPATTWDEFVSQSQTAIDAGLAKYGTSWGWMLAEGLTCDWTTFLYSYSGKWRASEDGQSGDWVFNSPEGVAALEFMMSTIAEGGIADPGSLELNDRTDLNTFMAGETLYNVNWSYAWWFANDPKESKIAGKMGVGIWPAQPPVVSSSVTGGGGLGIMANTADQATAWQYIQIATSEENSVTRLEKYSDMSPWKALYTDEAILAANPQFAEMGKQYPYTHFRPVVSWYTEWSQNMQTELHNAFTGAKSAQQALDDAVTFSNAGSEKYKS